MRIRNTRGISAYERGRTPGRRAHSSVRRREREGASARLCADSHIYIKLNSRVLRCPMTGRQLVDILSNVCYSVLFCSLPGVLMIMHLHIDYAFAYPHVASMHQG